MSNPGTQSFFNPTSNLITAVLAFLSAIIIERFKNRTLFLTYTTSFQPLGSEIKSEYWGNIQVLYNGRDLKHLNFVTVTIKNNTRTDAPASLNLDVWVDPTNQFLGHSGHYDAGNAIQFEDNFGKEFNNTLKEIDEDLLKLEQVENYVTPDSLSRKIKYFLINRKLSLPVLNRKSSVTINFMIENFEGYVPKLNLNILQKGIKLIPEADKTKIEQTKKIIVGLISLILNVLGLIWIYNHYPGKDDAITSAIIISGVAYILSYAFYYLYMWFKKIFA